MDRLRTPAEIAADVKRQRILEAAQAIAAEGGTLTPGRIARDARLPVDDVVELVPGWRGNVPDFAAAA